MNAFIKRHQVILLAIVLCLFSLHMALAQKKRVGGGELVEKAVSRALTPFQSAFMGLFNMASNTWDRYIYLVGLKAENEQAQVKISKLITENNRLKELEGENQRLKKVLAFKKETAYNAVGAKILAFNMGGWTKTIKLNKGSRDGIVQDMPVISPGGAVGRIIQTTAVSSTALLITDPRSNVDVILQRTRVRGIAEGDGNDGLRLKYIRDLDDVRIGDKVITAGLSGIFPKGLFVGEITKVAKAGDNFFKDIEIRPNAAIKKLEEVLIEQIAYQGSKHQ